MANNSSSVAVIDFRRRSMVVQWHALGGTWSAMDNPPALVHGIALIRAARPNICVYGHAGRLRLQVGPEQYALSDNSPHIRCSRIVASFGLRRHFAVESSAGGVLFSHTYWAEQGADFFQWLATKAEDPDWRASCGRLWSEGVPSAALRAG